LACEENRLLTLGSNTGRILKDMMF